MPETTAKEPAEAQAPPRWQKIRNASLGRITRFGCLGYGYPKLELLGRGHCETGYLQLQASHRCAILLIRTVGRKGRTVQALAKFSSKTFAFGKLQPSTRSSNHDKRLTDRQVVTAGCVSGLSRFSKRAGETTMAHHSMRFG